MQNSEGGSDSPASVALCPSSAAQAPVAQPVPASPQRVLVQAAGSAPKGAQMQPISLPRVQQVPQQVQPVQHVYPPQVQYVEGGEAVYTNGALRTAYAYNPEPQMYAPSSSASYFEAPGGAQVTVAGSSPTAVPAHSMVGITMDVGGSPIVSGTGAYLIHGGMDGTRHSLAHTSRSSPATLEMAIENLQKSEGITSHKSGLLNSHLQWLLDNYETAEGVSLPRSSLYNHYLRHCQEHKLDPVNAASFGKLIRSVFMGLRTRRLGTRGNSKYHYYGIRLKPDSPLNRLQEDTQYMAMRQQPVHQKPRYRPAQKTDSLGESGSHGSLHSTPEQAMAAQSQHHQQYIDVSHVFPEFPAPDLGSVLLQENITLHDIKALQLAYRRHCEATLDVVMNLQFHYVEKLWLSFWNSKASSGDGPASLPTSDEEPEGAVLPKDKLVSLCKCDPVLRWMRTCDHILYQALVEILIPDVLRPVPSTLTQAIRNFAKSLEGWLTNAMSDFPQQVIQTKVGVVGAFAQTLRRYTSLNHLAQAARAVLQNTAQISQMLSDLNRVDFANVQEQASWVCQCEEGVVQRLEQDFKLTLQQQSSLDQWASWLDNVVTQVLKQHAGSPSFPKAARQFLLKWSFYSSMVIRDLTLRSAASFGSFHLIRLLYDEYMFYLVEHRVAEATGETPIAVMGEFNDLASLSLTLLDKVFQEKPAIAPPVFVFQKDKGQKSSAEQKDLSDSGEEPRGEAEAPHHGTGHPESAGEHALELPAPASASASAPEAQLPPFPRELAGRSAGGSSPEGGEDSDREDGNYCPPVKRERTSSLTQFPPSQSVSKNNVFMPSTFCEPSAGNSDSEPEEKSSGFRLKPPTLIHGQAPSAGLPSQKPKEQQRSVLRPAVLQAPQPKVLSQTVPSSGTNGVSVPADCPGAATSASPDNPSRRSPSDEAPALEEKDSQKNESSSASEESCEKKELAQQAFVFGQNLRDRVKLINENAEVVDMENAGHPSSEAPAATNYFLQYISSSLESSANSADAASSKFIFGQNMSERVLSPPKLNEVSPDANRENTVAESGSESSSQEATPEKESLAESAAAYTKATARKCLLEKVEVITGEEAESNVLQIQCKLFVFDKTSQSWVERGRGLLRLNDMASTDDGTLQSRLVMRTQGSLRLILNTKLWAQMQMDKASEKSIRITAMDTEDQGVKVFLISASSKDTGQLYAALHHRILALRSHVEQEQEARTPAPEPGAAPSNEDDSDDDDVLAPSGATGGGLKHHLVGWLIHDKPLSQGLQYRPEKRP
ncbi:DNA-binding protein RFX2 isoform X2 [Sagmatias obliquidens]|uniref:DNA-binding protein RFX2 isoform X2 n=1 Tax=Sagmatias obliquidens TaxID=3371155 RepID=UPI000F4454AB|nr:DNA-binding protein RFX2 isoform X2 [Lagenorhynchus obliquidens]